MFPFYSHDVYSEFMIKKEYEEPYLHPPPTTLNNLVEQSDIEISSK